MNTSLISLGILALVSIAHAVSPEPPFSMELNEYAITSLNLNEAIETLLVFPKEIQRLSGRGLTTGKEEGVVQYQIGNIKNVLHLKPLEADFDILAKAIIDDSIYVFRLRKSDHPATVIRFEEPKPSLVEEVKPNAELDRSEVVEMTRLPSIERQKEMIRLVWEEHKLRAQLPHLYDAYRSRDFNRISRAEPFEILLDYVGRFYKEDCLVVRGRVLTQSDLEEPIPFCELRLTIGNSKSFSMEHTMSTQSFSSKHKPAHFIAILVGDGSSRPGHFRLENDFSITLKN